MPGPAAGADTSDSVAPFHDPLRLRRLHEVVLACRDDREPHLNLLPGDRPPVEDRLAVLAGSFNPLTAAHVALAEAAEVQGFGPVAFTLSTHTVDKERVEGALIEDRLLVLELHAARTNRLVALINRGLYVEQAELFRARLPRLRQLTFVVGFDKIVQVFDHRYYPDRDAALEILFGLARFVVAPRDEAGPAELATLLDRPENRRFAAYVQSLDLPGGLQRVASSAVRDALGAGDALPSSLAAEAAAFIRATGCYVAPQRYAAERERLLGGP